MVAPGADPRGELGGPRRTVPQPEPTGTEARRTGTILGTGTDPVITGEPPEEQVLAPQ